MIKLLFLTFSMFSNVFSDFITKLEEFNEDVVLVHENSCIVKEDENFVLRKDDLIIYEAPNGSNLSFVLINDVYYVLETSNSSVLKKFDKFGVLIESITIPNKYKEIHIKADSNIIYLYGSIYEYDQNYQDYKKAYMQDVDAFILMYDLDLNELGFKTYGGGSYESFNNITFYQDRLYINGVKDELTSGDFGNGGKDESGLFCIIDKDLTLIEYLTFDDLILGVNITSNITIILEWGIIVLNNALLPINSTKFDFVSTFGGFMINDSVFVINDLGLNIYEANSLNCIFNEEINIDINKIINNNKELLIYSDKIYKYEVYDLRLFDNVIYHGFNYLDTVSTINSYLKLEDIIYQEYFEEQISGTYNVIYKFDGFSIQGHYIVMDGVNITTGGIYPAGYRLEFRGNAYLNGKLVSNNHAIINPGSYKLVIYDNKGNSKEYSFIVEGNQKEVNEISFNSWDYLVKIDESLKIRLSLSDVDLKNVYSNGNLIAHHKDDEGYYLLVSYDTVGLKQFCVDYIEYLVNDVVFINILKEKYFINVINNKLEVDTFFNNDELLYSLTCNDENNQISGLRVSYSSNTDEYSEVYTITSRNLNVRGLDSSKKYKINIDLVYLSDFKHYSYQNILTLEVDGYSEYNIGSIVINKKTNAEVDFDIKLKNNNFLLTNSHNLSYKNTVTNNAIYYIIGVAVGVVGFVSIFILRKKGKWLRK